MSCWKGILMVFMVSSIACVFFADASNVDGRTTRTRYGRLVKRRKQQVQTANIYSWPKVAAQTSPRKAIKKVIDKSPKPNIIFIIADDLGYNDVGYHGKRFGSIADTPAIDALAYSGVRLENYYVQPSCTPTRASLLTGRYPIRLGLQRGNIEVTDPTCLPLDETTLPEKLRDFGYATHAIGKWHLGLSRNACLPTHRGFDSYFGILLGYASHYHRNRLGANSFYTNDTVNWGYDGMYSSDMYTRHAVNTIKKHNTKKPLFIYLSHQAAHSPMESPERYLHDYKLKYSHIWNKISGNKLGTNRKKYLGLVKSIDVSVHVVTEALKKAGMWNNTVLIFTSDNGGKGGGGGNNWPLRGRKNTLWEGGIKGVGFVHSPLLPTRVSGTVFKGLVHVSDWFPTLVEGMAGGVARDRVVVDGRNMWPAISQGLSSPRKELLHNIETPFRSKSKVDKHKQSVAETTVIRPKEQDILGGEDTNELLFNPIITAAIRHDKWKLITGLKATRSSSWEPPPETRRNAMPMQAFDTDDAYIRLYNIDKDPLERNNLASKHPQVVHRLLKRLRFYDGKSRKPRQRLDLDAVPRTSKRGERLAWRPWID